MWRILELMAELEDDEAELQEAVASYHRTVERTERFAAAFLQGLLEYTSESQVQADLERLRQGLQAARGNDPWETVLQRCLSEANLRLRELRLLRHARDVRLQEQKAQQVRSEAERRMKELAAQRARESATRASTTTTGAVRSPRTDRVERPPLGERSGTPAQVINAAVPSAAIQPEPSNPVCRGRDVREWRVERGFNQTEFAKMLGVTQGYVAKAEGSPNQAVGPTLQAAWTALMERYE